jgi:hypothetical protein
MPGYQELPLSRIEYNNNHPSSHGEGQGAGHGQNHGGSHGTEHKSPGVEAPAHGGHE